MKQFSLFKGPFSESFQESIEGDAFTLKERVINKFKIHNGEDIRLDKIDDKTLMFSNKDDNPFIRNVEKKSAYLTIKIRFVNEGTSILDIRIRPNSVYPIIFFAHTSIGIIGVLIAIVTSASAFWGGLGFVASGFIAMIFGQISKQNLYNNFSKIVDKINTNL